MQPPVEHAGPRSRASAAQAAWFLAVGAASTGLLSGLLVVTWLVPGPSEAVVVLQGIAPPLALLSWILAIAAVATAAAARRVDGADRRAGTALRVALPGAIAGTVVVALVVLLLASGA